MKVIKTGKSGVMYKTEGKEVFTHEDNMCSKYQYQSLRNKYQQIIERYCRHCDDVTKQGLWEDNMPANLLSGTGEFYRQCTICGSFNERPVGRYEEEPKIPSYAIVK